MSETVLEEAQRLVYGDRQAAYGHPRDNYRAIAGLIQAYLEARYLGHRVGDVELQPGDAVAIMLLMKLGRYATGSKPPKRDTLVDIPGYGAVLARVEGEDE